jgi:hypothetical protein
MLAALALHLSFLLDAFVLSLFERQEPHTARRKALLVCLLSVVFRQLKRGPSTAVASEN